MSLMRGFGGPRFFWTRGVGDAGRVQLRLLGLLIALAVGFAVWNHGQKRQPEPWPRRPTYVPKEEERVAVERIRQLVKSGNRYWRQRYPEMVGAYEESTSHYRDPELIFFSGEVSGACGRRGVSSGPFYCGPEGGLYVDLEFMALAAKGAGVERRTLEQYVVSHGLAHHVQSLLGVFSAVELQRERLPTAEWERLALRSELQAEFLAGGLLGALAVGSKESGSESELGSRDLERFLDWVRGEADGDGRYRERFGVGAVEQRARWLTRGLAAEDFAGQSPFEVIFEQL